MIFQTTFIPNSFHGIKSGEDAFTRHEDFTNIQIRKSSNQLRRFPLPTPPLLLTPSLLRSESVTTIRTSISKTFSLSIECTSTVIRFTLFHKRSPWMESEKILRKIPRTSPPTSHPPSSARHPLPRVQVPSRPAAALKQDSCSSLSKEPAIKAVSPQSTSRDTHFSNLSYPNPNQKNSASSSSPSTSSSSVPPKTWEQFMKDTEDFEPHWFVKKVPGTSPSKSPGQRKKKRK